LMFSVPAFAKNLKKNIESGIRQKGPLVEKLFRHALKLNYSYNKEGLNKGGGLQFLKLPLMKLYDTILFKKVRQQLGGNMQYFIGGGALLDIELQRFFYAIGIPIYQGYGLSEATPIISINTPYRHKLGSSGMPVKFMDLKICDEEGKELPVGEKGEIMIKGENVMAGYFKNEEATKSTIKNGWLHTGDMGYMDNDGFLYVLGRFKSLLISDDGEKYSPESIEEAFVFQSPYLLQCMLYNNQNPYTSIFVVPEKEEIKKYLKGKNIELKSNEAVVEALKLIQAELQAYRTGGKYGELFPQRWMPASIGIIDEEFTTQNQLLNSMQKLVRGKVLDKYKDLLAFLYTPESKNILNERNRKAMAKMLEG
jgi:long-chain acyl-CoA synthetase